MIQGKSLKLSCPLKKAHTMKLDRARISYKTRSFVPLCSIDSDSEEIKLVVPIHEINEISINDNDSSTVGNYGAEATYYMISKSYYLIGISTFITKYDNNCAGSLLYKAI